MENLKLSRDDESINIYIDNGDDKEPTHIVYWHADEWQDDPELVVPALLRAMELYYTDHYMLFKTLRLLHLMPQKELGATVKVYIDGEYHSTMFYDIEIPEDAPEDDAMELMMDEIRPLVKDDFYQYEEWDEGKIDWVLETWE